MSSANGPMAIECHAVWFRYPDGTDATRGIDLGVRRGEIFGLLGPNGAGKTTLVRQITTDLRPTEGRIQILGEDIRSAAASVKSRMGIIPQDAGLFDGLTPWQHLMHFGPLKGLGRRDTRAAADRIVEECGLGPFVNRKSVRLSGGQRRKVLVALAILGDPELLVLDEPTVGLDPGARREVWSVIRAQCDRGKAVLLTSHYLDEIEQLADRVGFMRDGELVRLGTLPELMASLDHQIRVTRIDAETGHHIEKHMFGDLDEANDFIRKHDLTSYSVDRVRLEDVYFHTMGTDLREDSE